jgi:phenylalanyl-tRNA synthetase beta chain
VIQGKMRRLGFASDAGYRFERGVDFGGCARAVERATQLIVEICGGRAGPLTDQVATAHLPARAPVRVRGARIERLLGLAIADDVVADVFTRLALPFTREGRDFVVTPPSRRFDLAIEEDFVEEVARITATTTFPRRRARTSTTCCRIPRPAAAQRGEARARRPRLAGGGDVQLRDVGHRKPTSMRRAVRSRS